MLRTAPVALAAAALFLASPSAPAPTAPARLAAFAPAEIGAATYTVDPAHTTVGFRVRHMGIANVEGEFDAFDGTLHLDPADLGATTVTATVQTASIDTDVEPRDNHLRSGDFFEAETYPTMTFASTGVQPTGPTSFLLTGDLTLKGVTKPVTFEVEMGGPIADPRGGTRAGFHGTTTIDRRDFGMGWGSTLPNGVPSVGNRVEIVLDVEATAGA